MGFLIKLFFLILKNGKKISLSIYLSKFSKFWKFFANLELCHVQSKSGRFRKFLNPRWNIHREYDIRYKIRNKRWITILLWKNSRFKHYQRTFKFALSGRKIIYIFYFIFIFSITVNIIHTSTLYSNKKKEIVPKQVFLQS